MSAGLLDDQSFVHPPHTGRYLPPIRQSSQNNMLALVLLVSVLARGSCQIDFYSVQNIDRFSVHLFLMCVAHSFRLSSYYKQGLFVSRHQYSKHRNKMSCVNECSKNKFQLKYQFRRCLQLFSGALNCTPKVC